MASVVPPLNTGVPVPNIPFFSITPGMLTSSSAVETAPAAYNSGTTYAVAATSSVAGTGNALDVYRSLSAGNIGHAPASSPSWWVKIGTTYPVYAAGTYADGDRVIDTTTHFEYLSLAGSNTAALSDATKWQLQGANNRYRMFDLMRNDVTVFPSGSSVEITPGQRVNSVGAVGLRAKSILIELIVGGIVMWSRTEKLSTRFTTGWRSFFFGSFTFRTKMARFDLTPYTGVTVRLTFTGIGGGDVSVGRLILGENVYLGRVLHGAEPDALNFSNISRNDQGDSILIPKRSVPKLRADIRVKSSNVDRILKLRDDMNAIPGLWVGLADGAHPYFQSLLILGIYKQLTLNLDKAEEAILSTEVEEA